LRDFFNDGNTGPIDHDVNSTNFRGAPSRIGR
jgi:hypothetical protein